MCGCRKRTLLVVGIVAVGAAASLVWSRKDGEPAGGSAGGTGSEGAGSATGDSVVVYYFHGALRCQTCLEIERISRETVATSFADEIASGRLRWESVDYDLPANEHFLRDFALQCPSLAVEQRVDGVPRGRTVLTNTWEKVRVPSDLQDYVVSGILSVLEGG